MSATNPTTTAITPPYGSNGPAETELPLLQGILAALGGTGSGAQGVILVNGVAYAYDYQAFSYYDAGYTNIQTIIYKSGGAGGATVAVQTFAYIGSPTTTANLPIQAIATTSS